MRLVITTPTAVVAEIDPVAHVRAADASGAFGILPGHADLLTVLALSVVSWRTPDGREGHAAVRGGVLTVKGGNVVRIATREAVAGDDLATLEGRVLASLRAADEEERRQRSDSARLEAAAIHRIRRFLSPGGER
ncbi:MAG: F0F1 ATP synthase subunit epsilon [Alphaproteobacteria bacterium]